MLSRWPAWVGYAASAWSLLYAALGLFWTFGGAGFPFGAGHDPEPLESILGGLPRTTAAPVIAGFGLIGTVVALASTRPGALRRPGRNAALRILVLGFAALSAVALLVVIPDRRLLMIVAYAPILAGMGLWVLLTGSDLPTIANLGLWTLTHQVGSVLGGLVWAGVAVSFARRKRAACVRCGRGDQTPAWTTSAAAARWGRWAVGVAVVVPLVYAATRWAWALGIRLGISEEFYQQGRANNIWWAGAALATLAIGGAVLTLGLAQRWGETYPRLVWFRAGRRVPPALAIVPASLVSIIVTSAGLEYLRLMFRPEFQENSWATMGPELLWPLWGVALAAATLAYHLRRRGACADCGRG
ncbi:NYN domain-containing protein [Actinopolymorpha pittospori]|uniref:Uncharacterized protein n=1 Tax=Actinopolymorpha pittospori TaxID=648752 RepID=A0A927N540_9ACTN|nr:NYN domain-containing protein [Actinopolymorpha pittospori]MBE1612264.1 hypothetical protein [Actinopolymorpha pittospori]